MLNATRPQKPIDPSLSRDCHDGRLGSHSRGFAGIGPLRIFLEKLVTDCDLHA
jgi:hypothetical protein